MAKMLITMEQFSSLSPMGVELHNYWMKQKPKVYQEMAKAGTLWPTLESEDNRLYEMGANLVSVQRMAPDMAKEVVRAEIYGELTE